MTRPIPIGSLRETPQVAALLGRLRRKLALQIWLHGVGGVFVPLVAWLAFVFFADWALHVPLAVRLFHLAVLGALPVFLVWREIVRHLRRVPDAAGLAVLVERAHPELNELLVTAVQVQARDGEARRSESVARILRDADAKARTLALDGVLHERPQALRAFGGILALLVLAFGSLLGGETSAIFFQRLIGKDVPWPQRTRLELIVADPARPGEFLRSEDELSVRIARGVDLPISVRALGEIPEEVLLHFKDGGDAALTSATDGEFRTLLRSCQEDLELYATGGDDEDRKPLLKVEVLDPPDIAALAVEVTPPAYVGLAARTEFDRDVQVLAGSKLSIRVIPTPADAIGSVRVLPADLVFELTPTTFPLREGESEPRAALGFELVAESSLRYRFELRAPSGLTDPDPGLFSVEVRSDERPEIELVSPARLEVETLQSGALRLSARALDDLGIHSLAWRSRAMGGEQRNSDWIELALQDAALPLRGDEAPRGVAVFGTSRIEVASLAATGSAVALGDLFEVELRAIDTRPAVDGAPDPKGIGASSPVRLRVIGEDEFLRRLQDRLARARGEVAALDELLRTQAQRTRDVLQSLESASGQSASNAELAAALAGERRVLGDCEALVREFAGALEGVLYARIDDKAGAWLDALDAELAKSTQKGFPLEAWKRFAETVRTSRLTSNGLSGQLGGLFELALLVSTEDLAEAASALDRAGRRTDVAAVREELEMASVRERSAQERVSQLLDKLAEWDNFQSILTLTRDILGRQKSIRDKTAEMTGARK